MNYINNEGLSIEDRLNLQTLSYFIYSGNKINRLNKNNFITREQFAYSLLERAVENICGHGISEQLENIIATYIYIQNQIHFDIGMKAGATLIVNLTQNFDND